MLDLRPTKDPDEFNVYINGRKFWTATWEGGVLGFHYDIPYFNMDKIAAMEAKDFPDRFCLHWFERRVRNKFLDSYDLERKGNKMRVTVVAFINLAKRPEPWLMWHPDKFRHEMAETAKKKKLSALAFDEAGLEITYHYPLKGTIGQLFQRALKETALIQRQAEKNLLKQAAANLK